MKIRIIIAMLIGTLLACQSKDLSTQITELQSSLQSGQDQAALIETFKKSQADMGAIRTQLMQMIEEVKGKIYDESTNQLSAEFSADYVEKCQMFAQLMPEDEQSPQLLFQAGETARSSRNFSKALQIYDVIYQQYNSFEKAPQALFLKAFTLDNDLKRFDQAKTIYQDFLAKYPNDEFADDTQFLLDNLGKPDDEIIKNFE